MFCVYIHANFSVYIRASGAIRRAWLIDEYTMEIHVGDPRAYSRFDGFQLLTFGLFLRNFEIGEIGENGEVLLLRGHVGLKRNDC